MEMIGGSSTIGVGGHDGQYSRLDKQYRIPDRNKAVCSPA